MHNGMFDSKRQLNYWDRRVRRDLILGLLFVAIAIGILASLFI